MVILDFFMTSKANLNFSEVSQQFHEIYKGKKVSFYLYKTDSVQLLSILADLKTSCLINRILDF